MDEENGNRERLPLVDEATQATSTVYSVPENKSTSPIQQFRRQKDFDHSFAFINVPKAGIMDKMKTTKARLSFREIICTIFPIFDWFTHYNWHTDIFHDIVSGFTVAVLHIPQGLAYSTLAGVPSIVGIYMAFFPVLIYSMMGTSRHISMGTFAVICMMASKPVTLYGRLVGQVSNGTVTGTVVIETEEVDKYDAVEVVCALSLVVGIWQLILGIIRLGSLYVILSEYLVSGLITGAAISVIVSQIKNVLGLPIKPHVGPLKVVHTIMDAISNSSEINYVSLSITVSVVGFLTLYNRVLKDIIKKRYHITLPMELLIIISSTLISKYLDLQNKYNVSTVGSIPIGFPPAKIPPLGLCPNLILDGLVIAIVSFAVNISMASLFAEKHKYRIDANQELVATGSANIFGSLFSCAPISASLTRSLVQEMSGGRTQLASIVSCFCLTSILLFIGPFFEQLPNCILGSVILVAMQGILLNVKNLPTVWRQSKFNGFLWFATFFSVVLLDIDVGLAVGISISLLHIILMGQNVKVEELGHIPHTDLYVHIKNYRSAVHTTGLLILRVVGGMNFANKDNICRQLYKKLDKYEEEKIMNVILDFTSVPYIDPPSVKAILAVQENLHTRGIGLRIANSSLIVTRTLKSCDFFDYFSEILMFPSVHDAVLNVKCRYKTIEKK